jgi:hypothetical protein
MCTPKTIYVTGSICKELENSLLCASARRFVVLSGSDPPLSFALCSFVSSRHIFLFSSHIYQGKDQAHHGEVPLNTFFLKDATIVEVPFSKHNKSCVFEIQFNTSSGNKDRTLVLEAESEADRTDWVEKLTAHLDTVSDHSRCCECNVL